MDKACVSACPTDCIHGAGRMLYINPAECIDCGSCVEACPVQAIFPAEELPAPWRFYADVNRDFYPDRSEDKAWAGRAFPGEKDRKRGPGMLERPRAAGEAGAAH